MKWEGYRQSENVEDRRGMGLKAGAIGGGSLIVLLLAYFLGLDPQKLAEMGGGGQGMQEVPKPVNPADQPLVDFTKTVLAMTEDVWDEQFRSIGKTYRKPNLVVFDGEVQSACGRAGASVGPFYCPGDQKVYIDVNFYKEMQAKLRAPGEFARAYVVAHEIGHHVQNLLGYSTQVNEARGTAMENQMSVRLELQADYLAGVWAHHAQKKMAILERGDVEAAINAAQQIGDDTLQKRATGMVRPEKFTHGTSRQRMNWFNAGLRSGDLRAARELFERDYGDL